MTTHLRSAGPGHRGAAVFTRVLDLAAGVVRLVAAIFAVLLVGHVLLTFFGASPGNPITRFFATAADTLVLWFQGLFTLADPTLTMVVNYGLAAVFWLVAAAIVAHLLAALR